MKRQGVAHRLDPQAVTASTLLIAKSASGGGYLMVCLVVNLPAERVG